MILLTPNFTISILTPCCSIRDQKINMALYKSPEISLSLIAFTAILIYAVEVSSFYVVNAHIQHHCFCQIYRRVSEEMRFTPRLLQCTSNCMLCSHWRKHFLSLSELGNILIQFNASTSKYTLCRRVCVYYSFFNI